MASEDSNSHALDPKHKISKIALVIAMSAEASPLIEHLGLEKDESFLSPKGSPWSIYTGNSADVSISVLTPGKCKHHGVDNVGTVPAAVLAYAAIHNLKPDLIVNAGTAGGFKSRGAKIGDVYIATHVVNHDRRIPLPSFDHYGVGKVSTLKCPKLIEHLNLKEGVISSGNSLDISKEDSDNINSSNAVIKDMEAAGIAWVSNMLEVPLIVIKSVTDIVDGGRPTTEEFLENLSSAAQSLKRTLPELIDFVKHKTYDEL